MRIADIIATYSNPGDLLLDLTDATSKLSGYFNLPGPLAREVQGKADNDTSIAPKLTMLELDRFITQTPNLHPSSLVLLFAERLDSFVRASLLELAAQAGLELLSSDSTDHRELRAVCVLRQSQDDGANGDLLRTRNEYRFTRALLAERDNTIDALSNRIQKLELVAERSEKLMAQLAVVREELGASKKDAAAHKLHAEVVEKHLDLTTKKMTRARSSVSFRLGRATKLAWNANKRNPLKVPQGFLQAFRDNNPIPEDLPELRIPKRKQSAPVNAEVLDTERANILRGLPDNSGGLDVALLCGSELEAEIAYSTPIRSLTPNNWAHVVKHLSPAYVLITSDGIAASSGWARFGTPFGRGMHDELVELTRQCRLHWVPVVYWDTTGDSRVRFGLPRGVRFDAIYSINEQLCGETLDENNPVIRPLSPAVEAGIFATDDHDLPAVPLKIVYRGAFDRRQSARATSVLEALLSGAVESALPLTIVDPNHNDPSPHSAAQRFPERFGELTTAPMALGAEMKRMRSAGLAICVPPSNSQQSVLWGVLRALACGANVVIGAVDANNSDESSALEISPKVLVVREPAEAADALKQSATERAQRADTQETLFSGFELRDRLRVIEERILPINVVRNLREVQS